MAGRGMHTTETLQEASAKHAGGHAGAAGDGRPRAAGAAASRRRPLHGGRGPPPLAAEPRGPAGGKGGSRWGTLWLRPSGLWQCGVRGSRRRAPARALAGRSGGLSVSRRRARAPTARAAGGRVRMSGSNSCCLARGTGQSGRRRPQGAPLQKPGAPWVWQYGAARGEPRRGAAAGREPAARPLGATQAFGLRRRAARRARLRRGGGRRARPGRVALWF